MSSFLKTGGNSITSNFAFIALNQFKAYWYSGTPQFPSLRFASPNLYPDESLNETPAQILGNQCAMQIQGARFPRERGEYTPQLGQWWDPTRNLDLKKKGRLRRLWGSLGKLFGGRWRKRENRRVNFAKVKDCGNVNSMGNESWCKYQTSLVPAMGSLSLLSYSSTHRDHIGILIHAFSYAFYLALFSKITEDAKVSSIFILILVCIAVLLSHLNYGAIISKVVYLGWNWISLLVFIYPVFSKLIYSSPPVSIERIRMTWCLLIFTSILALLYTLRREILFYLIMIAFYGSQAWVSGLLLTMQALFQTFYESRGKNYALGALVSSAYFWAKELANYLVPSLLVYIPKTIFNVQNNI